MNLSSATIGQLMIPVDDFERGVAFYKNVLGLQFLFTAPPQMAFFMCGDVRLLVGVMPEGRLAQRGSAIYFRVSDIKGVASSLMEHGVAFLAEPHIVHRTPTMELWLAEFKDADGNSLSLMSEVARTDA